MTHAVGIDVGGTFTDVVVIGPEGRLTVAKAATTPDDQSDGVLDGIAQAAAALGLSPAALLGRTGRVVHGTTVATNALLEGKAARVGMVTTAGHRDVIEMREGLKPDRYNLRMTPPAPLVPRRLRLGVAERVRADGRIETPLDSDSLAAALDRLAAERVEAVAVCFLHAWANPAHERAAVAAARARLPGAYVTASADVLPQIKEFERFSTTVANAAVGPVIAAYLRRLAERLAAAGYGGTVYVILSHGGVASAEEAARLAIGTALSGPAGGVAAAVALGRHGVARDLITFDMGGTSTDIALIRDGQPLLSAGRQVGEARIALPALEIVTLGAGGGSVAWIDAAGMLRVGPESAGADPGPACYGQGGARATVTDANLVLGLLDPARFLGGRRGLDRAAAAAAVERIGRALGLGTEAAAAGIVRLVNARMADGVRIATVRRGVDPRRHAILAFGGAAGLHVASVASELGVRRIVVPLAASVLSAWGMLNTDLRVELTRGLEQTAGLDIARLRAAYEALEAEGRARLPQFTGTVARRRAADMRYGEQVFEVTVDLDGLDLARPDAARAVAEAFHARHAALYTYAMREQEPVLVSARLSVIGKLADAPSPRPPPARGGGEESKPPPLAGGGWGKGRRVWMNNAWSDVAVFDFAALAPGQTLHGPAIVESETTTVLLRAGDTGRFDARGWLGIEVGDAAPFE
ncbi:MAG: hydantoinase/oxoprolinase family protein [Acetobacteraceae bacterium]|nr:hydantoinase/oxoprolinase family protein [Acetobacteraceae bacterium]